MDNVMLSGNDYTLVYNVLSFGTAVMFGAFVYFLTQMKYVGSCWVQAWLKRIGLNDRDQRRHRLNNVD